MSSKTLTIAAGAALLAVGAALLPRTWRGGPDAAAVEAPLARSARAEDLAARPGDRAGSPRAHNPTTVDASDSTTGGLRVRVVSRQGEALVDEPIAVLPADRATGLAVRFARTGSTGEVDVDALPPGRTIVRCARGPSATASVVAGATTPVEIRMRRGVDVEGEVVDSTGRVVAGADVWVDVGQTRSYGMMRIARTDDRGRFRVEDVYPYATVSARAPGHGPSACRRLLLGEGKVERVRLVLGAAGASLSGRVVDESGAAIAHASVLVGYPFPGIEDLPDGTQGQSPLPALLETDASGRFAADGLLVGKTFVTVRAPGHSALRETRELLATPARTQWTITLAPARAVEGVVVDAAGLPVEGAVVATGQSFDPGWSWSATTDATGRFRVDDLFAEGGTMVSVSHRQKGRAEFSIVRAPDEPSLEQRISLAPWASIRVRVVDERGSAIAGRNVVAGTPAYPTGKTWGRTDADGRATLNVGTDDAYEVFVTDPAGADFQPCARLLDVHPGEDEWTLTVRDADRPSAQIKVIVVGPEGRLPDGVRAWAMPFTAPSGINLTVYAESGRIESPLLQPGRYELTLSAPDLGTVPLGTVSLERDQRLDLGVRRLARPGTIVVRLLRSDAIRRAGGSVHAESRDGTIWARVGADGVARFALVQPGTYQIVADGASWESPPVAAVSARVLVAAGETAAVDLAATRGRVRRIEIHGLPSAQRTGAALEIRPDGDGVSNDVVLVRARFGSGAHAEAALGVDASLSDGRYVAEATAPDGRRATAAFQISRDGEPTVVVKFGP